MTIRLTFDTVEERNAYVARHYPEREGDQEVPGLFHLPDRRTIGIVGLTLWEYPARIGRKETT